MQRDYFTLRMTKKSSILEIRRGTIREKKRKGLLGFLISLYLVISEK